MFLCIISSSGCFSRKVCAADTALAKFSLWNNLYNTFGQTVPVSTLKYHAV